MASTLILTSLLSINPVEVVGSKADADKGEMTGEISTDSSPGINHFVDTKRQEENLTDLINKITSVALKSYYFIA